MSRTTRRSGFTLVELLVVAGALAVTGTQLLSAIQDAREAARRTQCRNNLKMHALALHNYHDSFNGFAPGWIGVDVAGKRPDVSGMNGFGWQSFLLPYIDQAPLYTKLDFMVSVTDAKHAKIVAMPMPGFRCPSDPYTKPTWTIKDADGKDVAPVTTTNYVASFGTESLAKCEQMKPGELAKGDGMFYHNSIVRMREITDGTSNTLLVGERAIDEKAGHFTTWSGVFPKGTSPLSRILASSEQPEEGKEKSPAAYSSKHKGGGHYSLTDGAVKFIQSDIDPKTFLALTTRAGGETIPEEPAEPEAKPKPGAAKKPAPAAKKPVTPKATDK